MGRVSGEVGDEIKQSLGLRERSAVDEMLMRPVYALLVTHELRDVRLAAAQDCALEEPLW